MEKKQLSIRLSGEEVGVLEQTLTGKMSFVYSKNATRPISIGMPVREEPYSEVHCEAFFGGLLPESDMAKKRIAQYYAINEKNSFALLKAIGYDCAGAISCHAMNEPIEAKCSTPMLGRILSDNELYENIKALPKKPLFMGVEGLRLSLAGVHDKAAVCLINNQVAIPEEGCPSTHILKPASREYDGLVENEYFCLQTASKIGLNIPKNEIRTIKDISFLLIERYDRRILPNGNIERIHQEDFCQAYGVPSLYKYQNDGGPGFKKCFDLLMEVSQPAKDRNLLMSAIVYNFLIANMDAHSKNFSLLQLNPSQFCLAPFYDLVCTRVYPDLTSKMAMKIGSKYDIEKVLPRHWAQLCHEINYSYPALKSLVNKQGEMLLTLLDGGTGDFNKIKNIMKRHINMTLERFQRE